MVNVAIFTNVYGTYRHYDTSTGCFVETDKNVPACSQYIGHPQSIYRNNNVGSTKSDSALKMYLWTSIYNARHSSESVSV